MAAKRPDVIVIGSGAAGSFAAKTLTERGLEVVLLEAGPSISPDDFKTDFRGPREKGIQLWARVRATLAGQPVQSRIALYGPQQKHLFVKDWDHPYSTPAGKPFLWIRGRQLGGRLHTYGRVLLRWSDFDFKAGSRDGASEDWPISYADVEPYYDRVEEFLGLRGCADNVRNVPSGKYVGPSKLSEAEQEFKRKTQERWPGRAVISWRYMPPNIKRIPQPILAASETGRLTIRPNAVARRILTDPQTGKATGVEFVDRETSAVEAVSADIVVVCASAIESVRLLLNSQGPKHPNGLGNSSGVLGRYFMDQVPSMTMGTVPGRTGWEMDDTVPPDPFYGVTGGVYIPRFENVEGVTNPAFHRGFAYQGTIGRLFSRDGQLAKFGIMGFGEMLPHPDNRISLSRSRRDAWGVPIAHIHCEMRENERAMVRAQTRAIKEIVQNAGLSPEFVGSFLELEEMGRGAFPDADALSRTLFRMNFRQSMSMGAAIHESGGARMGADPKTSVLDSNNQCWDARNVFVTDASAFASGGCAGTTLTIMALTVRACEYIANQHAAGKI